MPFPIESQRIDAAEVALAFTFPAAWRSALMACNGGEFALGGEDWTIHPVWDDSDRKRMQRTANHVGVETRASRSWRAFPERAVALADNGCGDRLIALPGSASIWRWDHETGLVEELGDLDPRTPRSRSV